MYRLRRHTEDKRKKRVVTFVVAALVCVLFACGHYFVTADLQAQAALSARQAILESANQCMAIEGSYPSSLEHLQKEYGLVVNTENYEITYEVFAENVAPTVVVTPR